MLIPPTSTPAPTATPAPQAQTLGPIWDDLYDETYNIEVSVYGTRFLSSSGWQDAKTDHVFVIMDVTVRNLGPGTLRSVGPHVFQVRDANGALRDYDYLSDTTDCSLEIVELTAGGSISGCIAFEVPDTGRLELIYAPYQYEGLEEGRYLSFVLR